MQSTPRRAFVTGGAGFVGSHVVEAFRARGYAVTCLVRDERRPGWLAGLPVRLVRGDLNSPDRLRELLAGEPPDVVVHVAGRTRALDTAAFERDNRQATIHLLEAVADAAPGIRRFIAISSLAAAGPSPDGRPLTEDAPCRPVSPYGLSKRGAEQAVLSFADRLPVSVVRPPVVYGPRDRDSLALFRAVRWGFRPVLGAGRLVSMVHAADLAQGIVLAAETDAAAGRLYFLAAEPPASWDEVTLAIARALGRRAVAIPVPGRLMLAAGLVSEWSARLRGMPTVFDRHKAREALEQVWACDSSRAAAELGFQPKRSLVQGIAETAAWYRAQGWL